MTAGATIDAAQRAHALGAARDYRSAALSALEQRLATAPMDQQQRAAHGFAWVATAVASISVQYVFTRARAIRAPSMQADRFIALICGTAPRNCCGKPK